MKDSTTTVSIAHPRAEISHCDLRLLALVLLAAHGIALGAPARGRAQRQDEEGAEETAEERTAHAAQAGMFLPFTEAPRTDTQSAFAITAGAPST